MRVYVVMELCVKGNLLELINTKGPLPGHSSCRFFIQLCKAVQYLHNNDVVHRDLKGENLLLDVNHNLKVGDFGFSRRITYAEGGIDLSQTYCGTSCYAPPEILKRIPYNPKASDLWSMGVVLYLMLYAVMPFDSSNITRMVENQMQHNINFPNTPSVSPDAQDLIRNILHPVVEQRITIRRILKNSWMLRGGRMENSNKAHTSTTGSGQEGPQDKQDTENENPPEDDSDPEEGPSTGPPETLTKV